MSSSSGSSSNERGITLFRQGVEQLPLLTQEIKLLVPQPEKFEKVSFEITERFKNMGSGGASQPITPKDLVHCTKLLREFQELTRVPLNEGGQSQESGGTRELVIRDPSIAMMRRGVNEGMFYVAKEVLQTGIDSVDALDLKNVNAFSEIVTSAKKLIEQSAIGISEDSGRDPDEDPATHMEFGHDPAQFYRGGLAYKDLEEAEEDPKETQGQGGRYTGQS
ncbi:putative NACHT-NTPase and P-loop NTPases N-terminal domain-containing protein [Seiridium unicorne]|uniref:NACHT-NTPase and P-loop NTPases N-terminal domain-containing protein n=1 Tax=Seiridium unicorne TaxID=138068 RepID=A0ABR2UN94_9PEZI